MPVTPTYPGVYVEEIPSGVRTIVGVATSITAFIGPAKRGPQDKATLINSFGDFERTFGGLWLGSPMSYAVRDFYLNGGSQAIIIRLFHAPFASEEERELAKEAAEKVLDAVNSADDVAKAKSEANRIADEINGNEVEKTAAQKVKEAVDALSDKAKIDDVKIKAASAAIAAAPYDKAHLAVGQIQLIAAEPGKWGAYLRATIDQENISSEIAIAMGLNASDLFNLTVRDAGPSGVTEKFINLTVKESSRRIDLVLEAQSKLVRWDGEWSTNNLPTISAASDDITQKEKDLTDAKDNLIERQRTGADDSAIRAAKEAVGTAQATLEQAQDDALGGVSDGIPLETLDFLPINGMLNKKGLFALEDADLFNLLCIPPYKSESPDVDVVLVSTAAQYCEDRRAMLLVDAPSNWSDPRAAVDGFMSTDQDQVGTRSRNAALYFPRLKQPNPLRNNQIEEFVPCGVVAGIFARTDTQRGIWKAPAGLDATLEGVSQLQLNLTDGENGKLNQLGINCLRSFRVAGRVVWGARTLRGADQLADEYKYVPVCRLALYIEESLFRGLQWVVFEPNDEPLWAQIRLNVGAFMHNLFRQGAFQGITPRDAYFVKCDKETTTQNDINLGIVNVLIGFAPLKPAEFVIIKLQQMAGQIQT